MQQETKIGRIINKTEWVDLLLVLFLFEITIFIFAPFEIYLSNKGYFFFDGTEMIPYTLLLLILLFVAFCVFVLVIEAINRRIIPIIYTIMWSVTIALYIQGNFVLVDYGLMDGTQIDWSRYKKEGIMSVVIFAAILTIGFFLFIKLKSKTMSKIIRVSSTCIILVQIVTLVTLMITRGGLRRSLEYVSTTNDEFNLSTEENFIILMLDTFDSNAMDKILEDENADDYRYILRDFTYYPDTLADYSYTDLAFPAILSGERYLNDETYGSYLRRAYDVSPLLNKLEEDRWYCGIYTTSLFADDDSSLRIDNCMKIRRTVSSHRRLAGFMYRLVGFRYLIQPLKPYCWFYPDDMKAELSDTGVSGVDTFNFNNFMFYDGIDDMRVGMAEKSFHWYHLDGTHPPFDLTPDFKDSNANNWEESGIYDEARAMMVLIDKFCNKLRELDVYDNSTIIIMADHGYLQKRQSPLFMIKGKGEEHSFTVSRDIQLAYTDLQSIYDNILEGKTSAEEIVDIPKGNRERIYRYYKWNVDLGYESYARDLTEYSVYGDCRDEDNLIPTGNVYSHGVK